MKKTFIFVVFSILLCKGSAQQIGFHNNSFIAAIEVDTSGFILRLQTLFNFAKQEKNTLIFKAGYKVYRHEIERDEFRIILYAPIMSYSFYYNAYNTPFNFDVEYEKHLVKNTSLRFGIGCYIYRDKLDWYGTISVPIK